MHVRGKSGVEFSHDLTVFQDSGLGGTATYTNTCIILVFCMSLMSPIVRTCKIQQWLYGALHTCMNCIPVMYIQSTQPYMYITVQIHIQKIHLYVYYEALCMMGSATRLLDSSWKTITFLWPRHLSRRNGSKNGQNCVTLWWELAHARAMATSPHAYVPTSGHTPKMCP